MRKIAVKITDNGYNIKHDTNPLITICFLREILIEYSLSLEETREGFEKEINRYKRLQKEKNIKKTKNTSLDSRG